MRDSDALARAFILVVFVWHAIGAIKTFRRVEKGFLRLAGWVAPAGFAYLYFETGQATMLWWTAIPGFIGLIGSVGLYEWARRSIRGRMFSIILSEDTPEFVHSEGPFAYIRHPFYASYLLWFWSSAAIFPSLGTIGTSLAMVVYFQAVTRFEEAKFARSALAPQYGAYQRRTGRFLPRLRKPHVPGAG